MTGSTIVDPVAFSRAKASLVRKGGGRRRVEERSRGKAEQRESGIKKKRNRGKAEQKESEAEGKRSKGKAEPLRNGCFTSRI